MFKIETGRKIRKTQLIQSVKNTESLIKNKQKSSGKHLAYQIQEELNSVEKRLSIIKQNEAKKPKSFLPVLHRFIKARTEQNQKLNKFKTQKLIQLVCIALMRLQHGMYQKAYQILVYIGVQLEDITTYQYSLKSIVYKLIFRVWKSLYSTLPPSRLTGKRSNIQLLMGNNIQYKQFKDEVKNRLRKSNLIVQKQFYQILHQAMQSQLKLPQQIHPSLNNYKLLIINIDTKSLSYSYIYPKILQSFITINEYRFMISKINQIIVPEGNCSNVNSTIRLHFVSIFTIFFSVLLIFFITVLSLEQKISLTSFIVSVVFISCLIVGSAAFIYKNNVIYKNPTIIYKQMINILYKLGKDYQQKGLYIKAGENIQYFHLYLNKDKMQFQDSDDSSSESPSFQTDSIKQQSFSDQQHSKNTPINHKKPRISISFNLVPQYLSGNLSSLKPDSYRDTQSINRILPKK